MSDQPRQTPPPAAAANRLVELSAFRELVTDEIACSVYDAREGTQSRRPRNGLEGRHHTADRRTVAEVNISFFSKGLQSIDLLCEKRLVCCDDMTAEVQSMFDVVTRRLGASEQLDHYIAIAFDSVDDIRR